MKRRNVRRSSPVRKIARNDVVPNALDKFRNALSSPEEFSNENEMLHVAELEKKKVIVELMPLIMKSKFTAQEAYVMVLELEAGIQLVIQDFLKMNVPRDASVHTLQGQDQGHGSDMETENVRVHTIVKTEIDDMTITHEWTSTASPERVDNMVEDGICIAQVRGQEKEQMDLKDVSNDAQVTERGREQARASLSRMIDFAFKEFKTSLSVEKFLLAVLDPSVKTEMVNKFLETEKDATVNLFQSSIDARQCQESESNWSLEEEVPEPEIETATESTANQSRGHKSSLQEEPVITRTRKYTRNIEEETEFKKLESLMLPILEDLRYPKDHRGKETPFPGGSRSHPVNLDASIHRWDLQQNIDKMKKLLNENKNFSSVEYRQIHARLIEAVKIGGKVLYNARMYYPQAYKSGCGRPVYVNKKDLLLWCMSIYVDIRECLPSQGGSSKLKLDKAEYEVLFLKNLTKTKMIEDESISLKWKGDNLGRRLLNLVESHASLQNLKMKVRRSGDLCMEAVHYFWKLRSLKLNWRWRGKDLKEDEGDSEPEGSKVYRVYDFSEDDSDLFSDDGKKQSINLENESDSTDSENDNESSSDDDNDMETMENGSDSE